MRFQLAMTFFKCWKLLHRRVTRTWSLIVLWPLNLKKTNTAVHLFPQEGGLFISLSFTLSFSPRDIFHPSFLLSVSGGPLFILTSQPVNLRSLDGHLSTPGHGGVSQVRWPRCFHFRFFTLASSPLCRQASRPCTRFFHLFSSLVFPKVLMDRKLQARPEGRLRGRRERASMGEERRDEWKDWKIDERTERYM